MDDPNWLIWRQSYQLSHSYWNQYDSIMSSLRNNDESPEAMACVDVCDTNNKSDLEREYLEFIAITRKHQLEREKAKLEQAPMVSDEYYKDISQVDTLVEDNLVNPPKREAVEEVPTKVSSEKVRSLEMMIDNHFSAKCQELNPSYWPVMPMNPKAYLNPIN